MTGLDRLRADGFAVGITDPASTSVRVSLVCEGKCNPSIHEIDAAIVRHEKFCSDALGGPGLWARQRTLRHTPHVMVSPVMARCQQCGGLRRFGVTF